MSSKGSANGSDLHHPYVYRFLQAGEFDGLRVWSGSNRLSNSLLDLLINKGRDE